MNHTPRNFSCIRNRDQERNETRRNAHPSYKPKIGSTLNNTETTWWQIVIVGLAIAAAAVTINQHWNSMDKLDVGMLTFAILTFIHPVFPKSFLIGGCALVMYFGHMNYLAGFFNWIYVVLFWCCFRYTILGTEREGNWAIGSAIAFTVFNSVTNKK